jgi:RNA-splicing ligase RtcB
MNKIIDLTIKNYPIPENAKKYLQEIASLNKIDEIIALPDIHFKNKFISNTYKTTVPSSVAISSSSNSLYPQIRYRGINCGMTVVSLPLSFSETNKKFLLKLTKNLQTGLTNHLINKFIPAANRQRLASKEVIEMMMQGSLFVSKKNSLDNSEFENMEFHGSLKIEKDFFTHIFKKNTSNHMKQYIGTDFRGNHFFEIQKVSEVNNNRLNLNKDQILIMFHTGGHSLLPFLEESVINKYFRQSSYVPLEANSSDAKKILTTANAIMNYNYAYRATTFSLIKSSYKKIFGNADNVRIITDKSHNSILKEKIDGEEKFIYRHNSQILHSNETGVIAGNFNMPSYLIEGSENIRKSLYSIDHGAGYLISKIKNQENKKNEIAKIRMKRGINNFLFLKKEKIFLKNDATELLINHLENLKIIKPCAKLEPIISLKYI